MKKIIGILIGFVALAAQMASAAEALPMFEQYKRWQTRVKVIKPDGGAGWVKVCHDVENQVEINGRKVWEIKCLWTTGGSSVIKNPQEYTPQLTSRTLYGYDEDGVVYVTPLNYDENNVTFRPVMDFNLKVGDLTLPESQTIDPERDNAKIETRVESIEEMEFSGVKRRVMWLKTTIIAPGKHYDGEVRYDWWIEGAMLSNSDLLTPVADREEPPFYENEQVIESAICNTTEGAKVVTPEERMRVIIAKPNYDASDFKPLFVKDRLWVIRMEVEDKNANKLDTYHISIKATKDTVVNRHRSLRLDSYLSDSKGIPVEAKSRYAQNLNIPVMFGYDKNGISYLGVKSADETAEVEFEPIMDMTLEGEQIESRSRVWLVGGSHRVIKLKPQANGTACCWVEGLMTTTKPDILTDLFGKLGEADGVVQIPHFGGCFDAKNPLVNPRQLFTESKWNYLAGRIPAAQPREVPPMFELGKKWVFKRVRLDHNKPVSKRFFTGVITRDTVVHGQTMWVYEEFSSDSRGNIKPDAVAISIPRLYCEKDGIAYISLPYDSYYFLNTGIEMPEEYYPPQPVMDWNAVNGQSLYPDGIVNHYHGSSRNSWTHQISDVIDVEVKNLCGIDRRCYKVRTLQLRRNTFDPDWGRVTNMIEGVYVDYVFCMMNWKYYNRIYEEYATGGISSPSSLLYACYDADGNQLLTEDEWAEVTGITPLDAPESAIEQIEAPYQAAYPAIYDLQGRRVQTPGRGLYIINGRKTLVR